MNSDQATRLHKPSALDRLLLAFANLRSYGIETRIVDGTDPDAELDRIGDEICERHPGATGCRVIIMESDLGCFDASGRMKSSPVIHLAGIGVLRATRAALADVDLGVLALDDESHVLVSDLLSTGRSPEAVNALGF